MKSSTTQSTSDRNVVTVADLKGGLEPAVVSSPTEFESAYTEMDLDVSRVGSVGDPHQVSDGADNVEVIGGKTYCVRELDFEPWLSMDAMGDSIPTVSDDDEEWGYEIRFRLWTTPDNERTFCFADLWRDGAMMKRIEPAMDSTDEGSSSAIAEMRLAGDGFPVPEVDKASGHQVWIRYTKSGLFLTRTFRTWLKDDIASWVMDAPRGSAGYHRCTFLLKTFMV